MRSPARQSEIFSSFEKSSVSLFAVVRESAISCEFGYLRRARGAPGYDNSRESHRSGQRESKTVKLQRQIDSARCVNRLIKTRSDFVPEGRDVYRRRES